jgi:hypothetical protein
MATDLGHCRTLHTGAGPEVLKMLIDLPRTGRSGPQPNRALTHPDNAMRPLENQETARGCSFKHRKASMEEAMGLQELDFWGSDGDRLQERAFGAIRA